MKLVGHGFGVGVLALVKLHGVPAVLTPPLPVLNYDAGVVTLVLKAVGVLQEFLLAVITLTAVYVAECPVGHGWNLSCQVAVSIDDFIGGSGKYGIIQLDCHGRTQGSQVCYFSYAYCGFVTA